MPHDRFENAMRALVLAAGRGERMRPLSDSCPKPLLPAGGRRVIDWQIDALVRAGIRDIVINTAHLAAQFEEAFDRNALQGVRLTFSREGAAAAAALETLGGIVKALPLLAAESDTPFVVVSGDVVSAFEIASLMAHAPQLVNASRDAHLVMVPNPHFNPKGDLGLVDGEIVRRPPLFTYANIGLFAPRIFREEKVQKTKLFPWMNRFIDQRRVSGELFEGPWFNIGTPADLADADRFLGATARANEDDAP
jgi:N-acetyl-alpha-D-muramate 1-phosphate uridylyltransferase